MEDNKVLEHEHLICQKAKEKLGKDLQRVKKQDEKYFADSIIAYLMKRCEDDIGLCEDICLSHKTWEKCLKYIFQKARENANKHGSKTGQGVSCCVEDRVVYEWAEDYYHEDDAEEEKKAEDQRKAEKLKTGNPADKESSSSLNASKPSAAEASLSSGSSCKMLEKPKKKGGTGKRKEIEGQMSLFDL